MNEKLVKALLQLYDENDDQVCDERCLQAKSSNNVYCKVMLNAQ